MSVLANRVAAKISFKWKEVAIQLELTEGQISAIEENQSKSYDRFMAVMGKWETSLCKPFTWATLVTALCSPSVNERRLANELERDFC